MQTSEIIRNIAVGVGILVGAIIGLPFLKILWEAAGTVKDIQRDAKEINATLMGFMDRVTKMLERHDADIEELKLDRARTEGFSEGRRVGRQRADDLHPGDAV